MFSSFVGTSKIVFAQAQLLSIAGCRFLLGLSWLLLWFCCCCSGSGSWLSDYTATADGYYYFSKFAVFLVSLLGSRECVCVCGERGKWSLFRQLQQLLCNWSSVAKLLAGNLNYLCRSEHGYGSRSSHFIYCAPRLC